MLIRFIIILATILSVSEHSNAVKLEQQLRIVTSIKPLEIISRDLLGNLAEVSALVDGAEDPHHYSLTVSDRRKLSEADLVIWMGPRFDRYLERIISQHANISVGSLKADIGRDSEDMHLWLDPYAAMEIAEALHHELVSRYTFIKEDLDSRLVSLKQQYSGLHQTLIENLKPFREKSFVADHNAYYHLANSFGLIQQGVVQQHDDIPPSAKHMSQLSETIKQNPPACFLVSRQPLPLSDRRWAERWQLDAVYVDLLGASTQIRTYQGLMESVAASLERCFKLAEN